MSKAADAEIAALHLPGSYLDWCKIVSRYSDQDPNQHINNTAICQYVEEARVSLRTRHCPVAVQAEQVAYVVASFRIRFLQAIRYPAKLRIGNVVTRVGSSSYTLAHAVFREGRLAALGRTVTVTCDIADGKPLAIPPRVAEQLNKLKTASSDVVSAAEQI